MNFFIQHPWELATALVLILALVALGLWLAFRKRLTPEEIEQQRRLFLAQVGRLVDGMLLDINNVEAEDGRMLTMLIYEYRIAGVDYECSQDLTYMSDVVNVEQIRPGFPCSVRYQPGNPQNSIVVAETWTGLRIGLPTLPTFDDPDPLDMSHRRYRRR